MSRYDQQAHSEAVSYLAAKEEELRSISLQVHENAATDQWTDQKSMAHTALANRHTVLASEVSLARERVKDFAERASAIRQRGREPSAYARFIAKGYNGITAEERKEMGVDSSEYSLSYPNVEIIKYKIPEIEAATRTDTSSASETVPETVRPDVVETLAFQGDGVMNLTYRFTTATGNEHRILQFDESTEMGTILAAQNTAITDNDLADFGVTTFNARTITSGMIPITREALQDSIVDLEAFANRRGGRRIMRRMEMEITLEGDGQGTRALSVINGAQDGVDTETTDVIVWTDLVNLIYSVPRAYRAGGEQGPYGVNERPGRVAFCFSDSFEKAVKLLKDGNDRPLWMPELDASIARTYPGRIFGYQYAVSMDGTWTDLAAAANTGDPLAAFGSWDYFGRRTVREVEMFRFMDSGTMVNNAIKILLLARFDFRPIGAFGTAGNATKTTAVRLLKNK